jgi:hypothetical protein
MRQKVFAACAGAAALAAVIGVSACGGTTTSSHPGAEATTAPSHPDSLKGVPFYRPSTVHSKTTASAELSSPDSVTKVSNFYVSVVERDGWTTVSKSVTPHSGNLTIKKSGQGATISVAPSGSGSLINISAYPTA